MFLQRCFMGFRRSFWYGHFNYWHILLAIGLTIGTIALVYWIFNRSKTDKKSSEYINILKERYIMGDITEEEYLKKKDLLNKQ